jgi:hypothetical protein
MPYYNGDSNMQVCPCMLRGSLMKKNHYETLIRSWLFKAEFFSYKNPKRTILVSMLDRIFDGKFLSGRSVWRSDYAEAILCTFDLRTGYRV